MEKRGLLATIVCVLLLPLMANAQRSEDSWENLKALLVSQKVQVVDQQLKSQDGIFISVSDDAITFRVDQQESTLERANVLRVSSREHMGRGKKALIGLGVGAAAGAAVGFIANELASCNGLCPGFSNGEVAAMGAILFAPIGAGVGALLPSGHPTIYRTERRQSQTQP